MTTTHRFAAFVCMSWFVGTSSAHADEPSSTLPAVTPKRYDVGSRSYGTTPENEPPSYVRRLSAIMVKVFHHVDWLDVGLEQRFRFEYHENDFTRNIDAQDMPLLLRTRAYVGLTKALDPFRFVVEVQDSRRGNSQFAKDDRDVNLVEPIQLYGALYFDKAFGTTLPISIRAGRMAFEQVDRRLVARNNWRNTTNTFQGGRIVWGRPSDPVQVDLFALQPLERQLDELDRAREGLWFFGVVANVRIASPHVVLQPYYFVSKQLPRDGVNESEVHAPALRGYGLISNTGFDYDASVVLQFGNSQGLEHRAFGFTAEVGYTVKLPRKMRLSASYAHATGDRDPDDGRNQRFDRMFGFARPFSNNLYFQWENLRTPKVRFEVEPHSRFRLDAGYGAFWLDSPTDRWNNPGLRDKTGASGQFIGQEADVQTRLKVFPQVDVNVGYGFFAPGEFPRNLGRSRNTHFTYIEFILRAFP